MLQRNGGAALAAGACGQHIVPRPDGVGRCTGNACKRGNVEDADGDDGIDHARAKHGGEHDGREQGGEGKGEVCQPHDDFFHPAPASRGNQPQCDAQCQAYAHGNQAHGNRCACTDENLRGDVAPKGIGAQPVQAAAGLQCGIHVYFVGGAGCPDKRQQGGRNQQGCEQGSQQKAAVLQRALAKALRLRAREGAGGVTRHGRAHISLALMRGSMAAYSTSTTKLTTTTMVASSSTQLRTTITSRLEMD